MTLELGGTPKLVCEANEGRGATWSRDGVIVFSPGYTDPLFRVSANGGVPVPVTSLDKAGLENSHRWPSFLPDGKHVLFVVRTFSREQSGLYVVSIDGGPAKRIPGIDSSAIYVSQDDGRGYLLYVRGSQIIGQEFKLDKLELAGTPVAVADLGWTDTATTRAPVSVSNTGVLVFGGGQASSSQLVWNDEHGKELSRLKIGGTTRFLRLSPDMLSVALERLDFRYGSGSLWVFESEREMATRFTFDPMSAYAPVWSPDGRSIAFTIHKGKGFDLTWKSLDATAGTILKSSSEAEPLIPTDWTSDDWIVYEVRNPTTGWDIAAASALQPEKQRVLLNSSADERQARVSPNGEWLAYNSNESGMEQIYVQPLTKPGPRFQISAGGGSQPVWDGKSMKVFYLDGTRTLVRTSINFSARRAAMPEPLFRFSQAPEQGMIAGWEYDISRDGTRFLTGLAASVQESKPLMVRHGWTIKR
jgi:Tol biopolymer transport system component